MKSNDKYAQIGAKIREAREQEEVSQKELADKLGYESTTAISLIESGARKVSVEDLQKLSKMLRRGISFFIGEKDDAPPIKIALRADKDLDKEDEDQILRFIDFVKYQK